MSGRKPKSIEKQIEDLRDALLSLKPAGEQGFEGFLRVVLTRLTGIPFRLAASGLQGGVDGDAAFIGDAVCFEAKRYDGDVPRTEVLPKIVDLARNKEAVDRLWILGATTEVRTQLANDLRVAGDQNAISTLILDWTPAPLPILAVASVAVGDTAIDFLVANYDPKQKRAKRDKKELQGIFEALSQQAEFDAVLDRLKEELSATKLATARAIEANKQWRSSCFGSRRVAMDQLGQALAVSEKADLPPLRTALQEQARGALRDGRSVVLSGGEGQGKSWLAAQICRQHEGLSLFASAERFDGVAPKDLGAFLVDLLIEQTGDAPEEDCKRRWRHRLAAWQSEPPSTPLLVVVDGLNQRPSLGWDRILNSLQDRLRKIGGRLLVTVRPQYWQKTVNPGVVFRPLILEVPEWTPDERDRLLAYYGIELDWLDCQSAFKTDPS